MSDIIESPYLLFLGDVRDPRMAKTAAGIHYWAKDRCIGQYRLAGCKADVGLPDMRIEDAEKLGAKTLVIGVAPIGGDVPESWVGPINAALNAGMDIASGMHADLASFPEIADLARQRNRRLIEVRRSTMDFPVGTGRKRSGMRLLTVGTDCGVGKMYASLALTQSMRDKGVRADFRATGQTGILIVGEGICIDAVVADFMAGAAETLSPDNEPDHWDVIEGQGSIHHPSYAGVSLALLHGSQPDVLVVCHDASRSQMVGLEGYSVPSLEACIESNLSAAKLVNPNVVVAGVCANTSKMTDAEALEWIAATHTRLKLPVCDPVRTGVENLVGGLLKASVA